MNQYKEQLRNLYSGILNNYPEFAEGEDASLTYREGCSFIRSRRSISIRMLSARYSTNGFASGSCSTR